MFKPERILGGLLTSALGDSMGFGYQKKRKKKRGFDPTDLLSKRNVMIGLGLAGLAYAAKEHFIDNKNQPGGAAGTPAPPSGAQSLGGSVGVPSRSNPYPPPPPPVSSSSARNNVFPPPLPGAIASTAAASAVAGSAPSNASSMLLIRAMIAAANADHLIDVEEHKAIMQKVELLGLDAEEREFLDEEINRPWSIHALVEQVQTPEQARQVYAVSLVTIDLDSDAERQYLNRLAEKLRLDLAVARDLEEKLG